MLYFIRLLSVAGKNPIWDLFMRAIIVGHSGQDGRLLCKSLQNKGYLVLGFSRSSLHISDGRNFPFMPNILDFHSMVDLIKTFNPDELYYLAAHHTSSEGTDEIPIQDAFRHAQDTHTTGLLYCLCAIRDHAPLCRLFYASSSLIFSGTNGTIQDENTPLSPIGFYAITKAQAMWICHEFRATHNLFASVGIFYNHESHLRAKHFLSQKIIQAAIKIANGSKEKVILGDLSARVDWSYAPDVVEAIQKILRLKTPDTFVVASGEAHSVQEFVEIAFSYFGLDWRQHVKEDGSILKRRPLLKIGNPQKLIHQTGWEKSLTFTGMVRQLIKESMEL